MNKLANPGVDPDQLIELLNALLSADADDKRRLIATHGAILLHPDAEALLRREAGSGAPETDEDEAQFFLAHVDLLAACRAHNLGLASAADVGPSMARPGEVSELLVELLAIRADPAAETDQNRLKCQIVICEKLLAQVPRQEWPEFSPNLHEAMGHALQLLGDLSEDAMALRGAEAALRAALDERKRERAPKWWAATQTTLGNVLQSLGALSGDTSLLHQAEALYRAALEERTRERMPMQWATTQTNLGNVLQHMGELTGDTAALRMAEDAYGMALIEFTHEQAPMRWAATQNNLGTVLQRLGELTGDTATLRMAEAAYGNALVEFTRDRDPRRWAATQTNLGAVLQSLGVLTGDEVVLRRAETAYHAALAERPREHTPMSWAVTQINLGNVLQSLGGLIGNAKVLRRAEAAFRAALEERTRERAPMDWAMTQNNLGAVLRSLGDLTGDAAVLGRAEGAYRAALEERTRERSPMNWAATQTNLGAVLSRQGALTGDVDVLRQAEAAYRAALEECNCARPTIQWATTQNNFSTVLSRLGELSGDAAVLRQAEQACRAALEVFTHDHAAMHWAATQTNLGNILQSLGTLTADSTMLLQAEAAYRAALEERTPDRAPMDCAATRFNLGNVLQSLNGLSGDKDVLRQAEAAYRDAMAAYDGSGAEDVRQGVAATLARLLIRQRRYAEVISVVETAFARSDLALMDAGRSREAAMQAVGRVSELYGLLSLCRLRQPAPDRAAALVAAESGRGRLLTDALSLNAVRPEQIGDPDIRGAITAAQERRISLRYRLGHRQTGEEGPDHDQATLFLTPEARGQLQEDLREATNDYVALCRRHGLIRATRPLRLPELQAAVPSGGALVLPVLTEMEAFAFVLTESPDTTAVIDLPRLNLEMITAHLSGDEGWFSVYTDRFHRRDGKDRTASSGVASRWQGQLTGTLAWLWERLLAPIHAHLRGEAKLLPDAPVVLLAPGLLGMLPLQAAGPGPDGRHFGDHWTVSFAVSVRALSTCRERAEERRNLPVRLLAVIDPPGEGPPLLGAHQEAPMLEQRFAHSKRTILWREQATLAAVLRHLPDATCIHAATHGRHDPIQPARSSLQLADTPLLLEMLHESTLGAARLVFLSACESGLAGIRKMPEEFIGLPAGFVQAGAACVIGSLWPIRDDAAFLFASRFYELYLDEDGRERLSPVEALRKAQEWLRSLTFGELRTLFPVQTGPNGSWVLLTTQTRFDIDEPGIPLPLGDDGDRPYRDPTHWAAFTATGA